jgi:ferredoxin, 2Fe-2S
VKTLKVIFVQPDDTVRALYNVEPGRSLMEVARDNNVVGIPADCGGSCACATCHVYVDPEWVAAVGPPDGIEEGLLEMVDSAQPGRSRLSCQIVLRPELDGLKVQVARN